MAKVNLTTKEQDRFVEFETLRYGEYFKDEFGHILIKIPEYENGNNCINVESGEVNYTSPHIGVETVTQVDIEATV